MRYGHAAGAELGASGVTELTAAIEATRVVQATRYPTLWAELRDPDAATTDPTGPRRFAQAAASAADCLWAFALYRLIYRLPSPLPGSESSEESTGTTPATRGALRLRWYGEGCDVAIRIGTVTIAGAYGSASTFGAPTIKGATDDTGVTDWYGGECLLPTGVVPGDDIYIDVLYRPARELAPGVYTGTLTGIVVDAPDLTEA
jgi:hypothetical protein